MTTRTTGNWLEEARELDRVDPLRSLRDEFYIPTGANDEPLIYLTGNSLGLQPRRAAEYVREELEDWQRLAVRGHLEARHPWLPYHEFLTPSMAELVGGLPGEVVMMNSLTINLHLMLATFYRPTRKRNAIAMEHHAFPSDYHAVQSQIRWHGLDPDGSLVTLRPRYGSHEITMDDVEQLLEDHGDDLAVLVLPGVQYYTGQMLPIAEITALAHRRDIFVGFDLAHAAGNVAMSLHEWDVDFAVWCSYKYLNGGPGSIGGCFVHERHATDVDLPRLAGWWGHDKETRFLMENDFRPIPTAEGWQVSNPPILSMAALRAALDVFVEAGGMTPLVEKSSLLTRFLDQLLRESGDRVRIITPERRGCQLSLEIVGKGVEGKDVHRRLIDQGVQVDWREPNVIRVAPVPLYNTFEEVGRFVELLRAAIYPE